MTEVVTSTIEHLDFDHTEPCVATEHPKVGDGPAVWAVRLRDNPCGHLYGGLRFFCDPCWKHLTRTAEVYCLTCDRAFLWRQVVISISRL